NLAGKYKDESLTYQMLYMHAHSRGTHLQALKLKRVGLYIDHSFFSVKLIHALLMLVVEMVLLNTRLTPGELKNQLEDVSVTTVIATLPAEISGVEVIQYDDLFQLETQTFIVNDPQPDDILSIMFTSGTTGRAKAVP